MATFERACQRKGKQTLGSCGENALEERRRLSDRAASETFATSVRRALRSSRGRQFLQAGPATIQGIVLDEARLPGERRRRPARLPAASLLVDALSRHYRFSTSARAHEGTVTVRNKDVSPSSLPHPLRPFPCPSVPVCTSL